MFLAGAVSLTGKEIGHSRQVRPTARAGCGCALRDIPTARHRGLRQPLPAMEAEHFDAETG